MPPAAQAGEGEKVMQVLDQSQGGTVEVLGDTSLATTAPDNFAELLTTLSPEHSRTVTCTAAPQEYS